MEKTSRLDRLLHCWTFQTSRIYLPFLTNAIKETFLGSYIPKELKKAEAIPVYKKDEPLENDNYRSASLLTHFLKIFERMIYKQLNGYIRDKLSKYITSFKKFHGTQHSLLVMLEKWKKALDKGRISAPYSWIFWKPLAI